MNKLVKLVISSFIGISASQLVFASTAHDPCSDLPGSWSGKAELQYFVFNCHYESQAVVDAGNPTTANVKITKSAGSFFCPSQGDQNVAVTCDHGRVEMKDSKIDVAGNMTDDGQSANLEGNLYALFRYHPLKLSVTKN